MHIIAPLRNYRLNRTRRQVEDANRGQWEALWTAASADLRAEVARQIVLNLPVGFSFVDVVFDDPFLIAELAQLGGIEVDGHTITSSDVNRSVALRLLPRTLTDLRITPEVMTAAGTDAQQKAEKLLPELEKVIRASWSHRIKMRTRTRFIINGVLTLPTGRRVLDVLIVESAEFSGSASRDLLAAPSLLTQQVARLGDHFHAFPSVVVALGAKAERDIRVVAPLALAA